ncbi:hypothetical protein DPEC_G00181730 [Dallia pectoralis]|uniref:Uncharacterized protein n=1 Tax=Dallia pectoralis TaxID=75939 RepID=A0ACC2GAI8_DALPE|nr:hypothetical protein DPEC_G00181730 [Dallia pectoralis]
MAPFNLPSALLLDRALWRSDGRRHSAPRIGERIGTRPNASLMLLYSPCLPPVASHFLPVSTPPYIVPPPLFLTFSVPFLSLPVPSWCVTPFLILRLPSPLGGSNWLADRATRLINVLREGRRLCGVTVLNGATPASEEPYVGLFR